jgi:hypothetical protein
MREQTFERWEMEKETDECHSNHEFAKRIRGHTKRAAQDCARLRDADAAPCCFNPVDNSCYICGSDRAAGIFESERRIEGRNAGHALSIACVCFALVLVLYFLARRSAVRSRTFEGVRKSGGVQTAPAKVGGAFGSKTKDGGYGTIHSVSDKA